MIEWRYEMVWQVKLFHIVYYEYLVGSNKAGSLCSHPTEHFTILLVPLNPPIDVSELNKTCVTSDFIGSKLVTC